MILLSEMDVKSLNGKYVLQVNTDDPDMTISEDNWGFIKEKRISFIVGLQWIGFYYNHGEPKTWEEFAQLFNSYTFKDEGLNKHDGTRFHRLLTSKEIDFVAKKMKEDNY